MNKPSTLAQVGVILGLNESEPAMSRLADKPLVADDHDAIVAEVLAAAGGDVRKAIVGLVLGQWQLEAQAARTVSAGYVRRGLRK